MTEISSPPPYPRIGEVFRVLAGAFDTKTSNRDIDRLAREGDFDWSQVSRLCDQFIVEPLRRKTDDRFADLLGQFINRFQEDYLGLVHTVSLDSLDRPRTLALLMEHLFSLCGAALLQTIKDHLGGPELARLFDEAYPSVATVLAWAGDGDAHALARVAFPASTGPDRSQREMVQRWVSGEQLPDLASIDLFCRALSERGSAGQCARVQDLRRWLVLARAVSWLELQTAWPVRKGLMQQLLLGLGMVDIGAILNDAVRKAGQHLGMLNEPWQRLDQGLRRTATKALGDRERLHAELSAFETLTQEHDPDGRTRFHVEWLWGRWFALNRQDAAALEHYERAVNFSEYRAGYLQKEIAKEALVLAARVGGKRPLLKRLKHRAIAWGWLRPPQGGEDGDVIEDWEIDALRQQFQTVFPSWAWFPEAEADTEATVGPLPWLELDEDELNQFKPDLRSPNRVVTVHANDGQTRRWSQLRLFTGLGKEAEVQLLLQRGASVDLLDPAGASALLVALQRAYDTGDRAVLDVLLARSHAQATLDSVTARKRLTLLLCAVDLGEADVVERLLEMKATPDVCGHADNQTPLYMCLGRLAIITAPGKLYRLLEASMLGPRDLVQNDSLRRYGGITAGLFGDKSMERMLSTQRDKQLFQQGLDVFVSHTVSRYSRPKLLRIAELLLLAGADPNAPHDYPAPGRTPLMLAAEDDDLEAFDLMLRHGGDPLQCDAERMDCLRIALGFGSRRIVERLRA